MSVFIADWLQKENSGGPQDSVGGTALNGMPSRKNDKLSGYTITGAKVKGGHKFSIALCDSYQVSTTAKGGNRELTLLVNPSDLNFGSSQNVSSQYTRANRVNIPWGPNQTTITGSGSSAAFLTTIGGLADSAINGISRKDSLAYANLVSFISMIRSNGYHQLTNLDRNKEGTADSKVTVTKDGEGRVESVDSPKENSTSYAFVPDGPFSQKVNASRAGGLFGVSRSGVVHVMDHVKISYGGAKYIGSFAAFTLDASADNPFLFRYSFEFVVSGTDTDKYEGHIHDGKNSRGGIIIALQGSKLVDLSTSADVTLLEADKPAYIGTESLQPDSPTELLSEEKVREYVYKGLIRLRIDAIDIHELDARIVAAIPAVYEVYKKYADAAKENGVPQGHIAQWFPPILNYARDGKHSEGSKHYKGQAFDFCTNRDGLSVNTQDKLAKDLSAVLGGHSKYDVISEHDSPATATSDEIVRHLHIEIEGNWSL